MPVTPVPVPSLNRSVFLHDRKVLKRFRASRGFSTTGVTVPPPPTNVDYAKQLTFPIYGNDQYGDCEVAAACHASQTWTGNVSTEDTFDVAKIIPYYLKLSGGDNGLNTDVMMGAWKKGLVDGPHKIIDSMNIVATDQHAMQLATWLFGGIFFTLAVPDKWIQLAAPGYVWDAGPGIHSNPRNGHAVWFNTFGASGYGVQTWGIAPHINITLAGVALCDPEASVCFSLDWFDPTGKAPNGFTYDQLAGFWVQFGGHQLPPSPFVVTPPGPPPVPTPHTPAFHMPAQVGDKIGITW